jgi:uncharacterized membrane protein YkvA (DUF1232 family)
VRDQIQRLRNELDRVLSARRWLIWRRLRRLYQVFATQEIPWWARGLVILVLLYGISPLISSPMWCHLVGWLDDATLLLLLCGGWEKCLPGEVLAALTRPSERSLRSVKGASKVDWKCHAGCVSGKEEHGGEIVALNALA